MMHQRINAYKTMWMFVLFDLPVQTRKQRKEAAEFRNHLLRDGFIMMQFSVYIRTLPSLQSKEVHVRRIRSALPRDGHITIFFITDKQYSDAICFWGRSTIQQARIPGLFEEY